MHSEDGDWKDQFGFELVKKAGFVDLILESLNYFLENTDTSSELFKDEAVKCLTQLTTHSTPHVAKIICKPQLGVLKIIHRLLTSNQSNAVQLNCYWAIANLMCEPDLDLCMTVIRETFLIDLLDGLVVSPAKHLTTIIPFLISRTLVNLLSVTESQVYNPEMPVGVCLRALSATVNKFGSDWTWD